MPADRNSNVVPLRGRRQDQDADAPEWPHSIETEQGLLGAILCNNDLFGLVSTFLQAEHFFEEVHAHLFHVAGNMIAAGHLASPITMRPYVGDADLGGLTVGQYLARMAASAATNSSALGYARVVRDLASRREVIRVGLRMAERARSEGVDTPATAIIEEAEAALLEARGADPQTHLSGMTAADSAAWMIDRVERMRAGDMPVEWISTGIPELDRATGGGYGRGQLWLLAGRPGMGKTVTFTTLSRLAARTDPTLAMQFETQRDQQMARYLADLAYIHDKPLPFGDIMKAKDLDEEDVWRVRQASERFAKLHLRLEVKAGAKLAEIAFMIRAENKRLAKLGQRLGAVFIDYIKYIKATERYKGQKNNEYGEITVGLKTLAKTEDIAIVLLVQLNRGTEARDREDKRPTLGDLGVSGDLEQDADVVAFLYREAYYLQERQRGRPNDAELAGRFFDKRHDLEFILGKNRAGPLRTIDLFADVGHSHIAPAFREGR
ncbi:helicase DnaB [Methylobacterium aquaticum]|uniref:DNA 5'-3' helicase n=2 Tax=Methylobacterium aquaticum TaxID=270351 RepID=A0A0C6FP32_9HYPH|nr:helicase DnaB [Methylobacterium aquaticum]